MKDELKDMTADQLEQLLGTGSFYDLPDQLIAGTMRRRGPTS